MLPEFTDFPKMARLSRDCVVTEKIDGTNASVLIENVPNAVVAGCPPQWLAVENEGTPFAHVLMAGSRTKWIHPGEDNYGFAKWAYAHKDELFKLGAGRHFGEWWGSGIQRNYGLKEKRFSLFNTLRWYDVHGTNDQWAEFRTPKHEQAPECCYVVPILAQGIFQSILVEAALDDLRTLGSFASRGFMKPEGVVTFHVAAGIGFKKTIEKDEVPKSLV